MDPDTSAKLLFRAGQLHAQSFRTRDAVSCFTQLVEMGPLPPDAKDHKLRQHMLHEGRLLLARLWRPFGRDVASSWYLQALSHFVRPADVAALGDSMVSSGPIAAQVLAVKFLGHLAPKQRPGTKGKSRGADDQSQAPEKIGGGGGGGGGETETQLGLGDEESHESADTPRPLEQLTREEETDLAFAPEPQERQPKPTLSPLGLFISLAEECLTCLTRSGGDSLAVQLLLISALDLQKGRNEGKNESREEQDSGPQAVRCSTLWRVLGDSFLLQSQAQPWFSVDCFLRAASVDSEKPEASAPSREAWARVRTDITRSVELCFRTQDPVRCMRVIDEAMKASQAFHLSLLEEQANTSGAGSWLQEEAVLFRAALAFVRGDDRELEDLKRANAHLLARGRVIHGKSTLSSILDAWST